jgi:3-hydroxymyristoyl/3-hydroxydecanoyl-(acyl carrier protein) dehydratase
MIETVLDIPSDHPAYQGHFPDRPILPAVVLLAEVLAVAGAGLSLSNAKFLRPVAPGTPLTLAHEVVASGVRFEIRSPAGVVASGTLSRQLPR